MGLSDFDGLERISTMSQETDSAEREERKELPIERGFPIQQVNDIAEKEGYGGARQWYRPIYTMHKWWARRMGSVFRSISLYTLLDDPEKVEVFEPGENTQLSDFSSDTSGVDELLDRVSLENPDSLWPLYPKDVRMEGKKVLDPFMGGGTSIIEASRFGAECHGRDLNPVAWFVTKKEVDTGSTNVETLEDAFEEVENAVADELRSYYKTPCPNHPDDHDAGVINYFWVKQLDCVSCSNTVSLFDDYRVAKGRYGNDDKYHVFCPECETLTFSDDYRSETNCECGNTFVPSKGTAGRGNYTCTSCGQKYRITDAIQEQDGFDLKLYSLEYYCPICDERRDYDRSEVKGYRTVQEYDLDLFEEVKKEWKSRNDLDEYIPNEAIPEGHMTSTRNPVFDHGYEDWVDMFNPRQLLCLGLLMEEIEGVSNQNAKEYLLLTLTDCLRRNTMMIGYNYAGNQVSNLFRNKAFDPPMRPAEGNIWGMKYGTCTFRSTWDKMLRGVKWGNAPTDRYIEYPDSAEYPSTPVNSELDKPKTIETDPFSMPAGQNVNLDQGDVRQINAKNEYDAIITDPPYYDNVFYSELSDFFYVWMKVLLKEEYPGFDQKHTPRTESIVANPFFDKGEEEFESELHESFSVLHRALKESGSLVFTYHHSGSESWGELLESLCDSGFEITATYPITADISKFTEGEAVEFDIIIIARPAGNRQPISWNSLRRNIVRTAKQTHQRLIENREFSEGDIGVIEMGRAFHEYSKHHGKVQRRGEIMSAKDIVNEIYGIIQQGSDIGEVDVFLDLLEMVNPSYNDLNMLTRGTSANPDEMKDMRLYRMDGNEFILGTWEDEIRQAYIQQRVNGEGDNGLTPLDKAQFLRYRYEHGKSIQNYLQKWTVSDDLRELCAELADASGDDVYQRILGDDRTIGDY